jgi:hypothetical protein
VPDFSRISLANDPINVELNALVERTTMATARAPRPYLGASIVGDPCLRKIQFDWWCASFLSARTLLKFDRGHAFEALMRARLEKVGFAFAPSESLEFRAFDNILQGHADGVVIAKPAMAGVYLPTPFVWENKCLNNRNFQVLARDGLDRAFPRYAVQTLLYQHYLDKPNPALFTAVNADTCEALHFLVPYSAEHAQLAIKRVEVIIEATKKGELFRRAYDDPEDWRCALCPHNKRCWGLGDASSC